MLIHEEGESLCVHSWGMTTLISSCLGLTIKYILACGLGDSDSTSHCLLTGPGCWQIQCEQMRGPISSHGLKWSGEHHEPPYEAIFIREYGVISVSQYLIGREINVRGGEHQVHLPQYLPRQPDTVPGMLPSGWPLSTTLSSNNSSAAADV